MPPKTDSVPNSDMLKANTSVIVVLIAVLTLTLVAVLAGLHAAQAEAQARKRLWNAYIDQARAMRAASQAGRRQIALADVSNAASIGRSPELRTEAIACLALSDLVQEGGIAPTPRGLGGEDIDATLTRFAYGETNGNVVVGRLKDGKQLFKLSAQYGGQDVNTTVGNLAFSPDGRWLAARFASGQVAIWDLNTRNQLNFSDAATTNDPMSGLAFLSQSGLTFSRDSKKLFFSDLSESGMLSTFEVDAGRKETTPISVGIKVFRVRPDMKAVAVADSTRVDLMTYPAGAVTQTLTHMTRVALLAWSPDAVHLAVSCESGEIYLWDTSRTTARLLSGHSERCITMGFDAAGKLLFTSSRDGRTRVWDTASAQEIAAGEGIAHGFSTDAKRLGFWWPWSGFGVWDVVSSPYYAIHQCEIAAGPLFNYDLSINGRWCAGVQNEGFRIWDLAHEDKEYYVPLTNVLCVRFASDEKSLYVCTQDGLFVWPLALNEAGDLPLPPPAVKQIPLPDGRGARAIALAADGRSAAVELTDRRMFVLHLAEGGKPTAFPSQWGTVNFRGPGSFTGAGRFVISPDGRWVATGFNFGGDDFPRVWDARTGALVKEFKGGTSLVAFSPDGDKLALAGMDHYSVWSVGDWQKLAEFTRDEFTVTHGTIAFTRDNSLLAFGRTRQVVQLRTASTDEPIADLLSPIAQSVNSVRLAHDGSVLVTATANDMVEVWRIGKLRQALAKINLDWDSHPGHSADPGPNFAYGGWRVGLLASLAGFGLAVSFAFVLLKRQRAAIRRFVAAELQAEEQRGELDIAKIELMHSQKMQALGTLAAGIAHDFNNLLSVVRMSNRLIGRAAPENPEIQEYVADIEEVSVQGKNVIRSMLGYARDESSKPGPTDVDEIVERTVSLLNREFLSGIQLTLELAPELPPVAIRQGRLEQILLNLIVNASEAMSGRGKLKISVQHHSGNQRPKIILRPKADLRFVELTVGDSGPGVPPQIVERIFEPFFSTKGSASTATGLGLSLVYSIAQQDGAGLSVDSELGKGALFAVLIPIANGAE